MLLGRAQYMRDARQQHHVLENVCAHTKANFDAFPSSHTRNAYLMRLLCVCVWLWLGGQRGRCAGQAVHSPAKPKLTATNPQQAANEISMHI